MGAWIEINSIFKVPLGSGGVASFMGAWIEISNKNGTQAGGNVASFMGAWIEMDGKMMGG